MHKDGGGEAHRCTGTARSRWSRRLPQLQMGLEDPGDEEWVPC